MKLKQFFSRRPLWTVGLYRLQSAGDAFDLGGKTPEHFFGEAGFRLGRDYRSTTADPFLFAHGDRLYLFYEVKTDFGQGEVWAESMGADGRWQSHGQVLAESFHISYPNVFTDTDGRIYMLPETAASGKVWLYTTDEFPFNWRRAGVLLDTPLSDPSILFTEEGVLLLGTTRQDEFKVYSAPALEGPFDPDGLVITRDRAVSRSGGVPFQADGALYRPAQNCKNFYGENISIMAVDKLGRTDYREALFMSDLCPVKPKWMELGSHHMSICKFGDDVFLAVDGRRRDKYMNTLLLAWFKLLEYLHVGDARRRLSPAA